MSNEEIRESLLNAGVKSLHEFGYPDVTTETILTDAVYKRFFKSMLIQNIGHSEQLDEVIRQILTEIG